jgi:hypothetical protein
VPRRTLSDAIFLALVAGWLCLSGCRSPVTRADITTDTLAWSANIDSGRDEWLAEARKRFDNPFVFVVHGDTDDGKNWWVAADDKSRRANIEAIGGLLHSLMPDRDIVLISCNERGLTPKLPKRVWYVRRNCWSYPRGSSWLSAPKHVADTIWEFQEGVN